MSWEKILVLYYSLVIRHKIKIYSIELTPIYTNIRHIKPTTCLFICSRMLKIKFVFYCNLNETKRIYPLLSLNKVGLNKIIKSTILLLRRSVTFRKVCFLLKFHGGLQNEKYVYNIRFN